MISVSSTDCDLNPTQARTRVLNLILEILRQHIVHELCRAVHLHILCIFKRGGNFPIWPDIQQLECVAYLATVIVCLTCNSSVSFQL